MKIIIYLAKLIIFLRFVCTQCINSFQISTWLQRGCLGCAEARGGSCQRWTGNL